MQEITILPLRTKSRILISGYCRTLHNALDTSLDPRGKPRAFTYQETTAIRDYIDNPSVSINNLGAPWRNLTKLARVSFPKTYYFKFLGRKTIIFLII
jgi:hypothetical protein